MRGQSWRAGEGDGVVGKGRQRTVEGLGGGVCVVEIGPKEAQQTTAGPQGNYGLVWKDKKRKQILTPLVFWVARQQLLQFSMVLGRKAKDPSQGRCSTPSSPLCLTSHLPATVTGQGPNPLLSQAPHGLTYLGHEWVQLPEQNQDPTLKMPS